MELNHNCVRDVLLYLESETKVNVEENGLITWTEVPIEQIYKALLDYSKEDIYYSLFNIEQAGYIEAISINADCGVLRYIVKYITFEGHEFLEGIKKETNWNKTLEIAGKAGSFGLNMLAKISEGVATAYFNKALSLN